MLALLSFPNSSAVLIEVCVLFASLFLLSLLQYDFKAGDTNAERSVAQDDAVKMDKQVVAGKSEDALRDKPSKRNRKKDKEKEKENGTVDKVPTKPRNEKRLLILPLEASAVAILLLIVLGSFYVVCL